MPATSASVPGTSAAIRSRTVKSWSPIRCFGTSRSLFAQAPGAARPDWSAAAAAALAARNARRSILEGARASPPPEWAAPDPATTGGLWETPRGRVVDWAREGDAPRLRGRRLGRGRAVARRRAPDRALAPLAAAAARERRRRASPDRSLPR